jgi:hypothetical protein
MGGEAVLEMLREVDVHTLAEQLRLDLMRGATSEAKRKKYASASRSSKPSATPATVPSG